MIFLKRKQETEVGHGECRGKAKGLLLSIMPSRLIVVTIPHEISTDPLWIIRKIRGTAKICLEGNTHRLRCR